MSRGSDALTLLQSAAPAPDRAAPSHRGRAVAAYAVAVLALVAVAAVHLTQGTAEVDGGDLLRLLIGGGDQHTWDVLVASRLPRLLAGITVGLGAGAAGAALQSLARNPLASPDTLGVNAGAHLAVVAVAAFGVSLPGLLNGAVAFIGGILAAALVFALSAGGVSGPTRLILAGTATSLALFSVTMLLQLLYKEETVGLFAWGSGTLVQSDLSGVQQMAPIVVAGIAAAVVMGTKLDVLALGDDTASVLGVHVGRTRAIVVLIAVTLAAATVALAGPIGFVGLCAPVIVRLAAPLIPGLFQHRVLIPMAALAGALIVIGADVILRALMGGDAGVSVPTGVVTTVLGAALLIWLARRTRDSGPTRRPPSARPAGTRSGRRFWAVVGVAAAAVALAVMAGLLLGDTKLLTGDVLNWLIGRSGPVVTLVLDLRVPRVVAALLAGAALALAGAAVQAVCRNPLAEPNLLGITAGAGVTAVSLVTFVPLAGAWIMTGVAGIGALAAFGAVYRLSWRGGLSSDRLILIGIGMHAGLMAVTTFIIVYSDPWNIGKALTWLSGSTYGATLPQVLPVLIALLVVTPVMVTVRRELDLLSLDDDTPRVLGVRLEAMRMVVLGGAVVLATTAVSAIGVVGFVGLVAPHAARALVGSDHRRVIPVALLLGAVLVSLADTVGRTIIAPSQVPAGLLTAILGSPYFIWLLWRSRA